VGSPEVGAVSLGRQRKTALIQAGRHVTASEVRWRRWVADLDARIRGSLTTWPMTRIDRSALFYSATAARRSTLASAVICAGRAERCACWAFSRVRIAALSRAMSVEAALSAASTLRLRTRPPVVGELNDHGAMVG
jgi:anti-sigma-K factor RskA